LTAHDEHYAHYLELAERRGLIDPADTAVIFYDLSVLARQVDRVRSAFPHQSIHAIAVKTNPLLCVLRQAAAMGLAAEVASHGELLLAERAGFGSRIIWDSPVKTREEIRHAGQMDLALINADSLAELFLHEPTGGLLGLRINPEIAPVGIASLSTGVRSSRFGTPISDREGIIAAFLRHRRLRALHVHSGSNPVALAPLVNGIRRVLDLAADINRALEPEGHQDIVRTIDIGGGLPLANPENDALSVEAYARSLEDSCPELFEDGFTVATEFGRYYHGASSWTVARVHAVKSFPNGHNVIVHVGADHFVREAYDGRNWALQFDVIPGPGRQRDGLTELRGCRIAGPLCFEGDVIANDVSLPPVAEGDFLVIKNTGANTYGLWSRHCSRLFPKVIMFSSANDGADMVVGRQRESPEDLVRFWS
jgi:diaminopimelate decarboxylase